MARTPGVGGGGLDMAPSTDSGGNTELTHGDLQSKLIGVGFAIGADEFARGTLGPTTRAALRSFQEQQGLKVTGSVNKQTVTALAGIAPLAASDGGGPTSLYVVSGAVTGSDSAAVGRLVVMVVDKNVGADVALAKGLTDPSGAYTVQVTVTQGYLQARGKASPDLQAQAIVGGRAVAASDVAYGGIVAGPLNISLPADIVGLPSEYETLSATMGSVYPGALDQLQEVSGRQDITYLAHKTGWDARAVALLALSNGLGAAGATDADSSGKGAGVNPAFYYALLRAGVGTEADDVFAVGAPYAQAVWTRAIADNIIPASLADEVENAVQGFTAIAAGRVLDAPSALGPSTLGQILDVTLGDDPSAKATFAELYVQAGGAFDEFWQQVGVALGAEKAAALQFDGKLAYLLVNNAPLLSALHEVTPLANPSDLASNGYHDPAAWLKLLSSIEPPAEVPGDSDDDRRSAYAAFLAAQVRVAFPTETVGHLVDFGAIEIPAGNDVRSAVTEFLGQQGQSFDIGAEPVAEFVARTGTTLSTDAAAEISRIQRVYQLAPDTQSLAALLNAGLDSAHAIVRLGGDTFAARYGEVLGADTVRTVFRRAITIHSATLQVAVNYLNARTAPALGGPAAAVLDALGQANGSPPPARATLDDLFHDLDYCSCDDCQSITSPAAYLVDLLDFLDHPAATPNPLDALLGRRPDIGALQLTCENTNTPLPYLDLVNEALEYYVGNSFSLASYQGHNNDGLISSPELIAAPQFDDDPASGTPYTILKGAWFPPPLPFHRDLELLRLHLTQIRTSLHDVLKAFRSSESLDAAMPADPASYGWRDTLAERIALSRPRDASAPDSIGGEYRLLTDSSLTLAQLFGFPPGTSDADLISQLSALREFSRRTSVDYADLVLILETAFVNPATSRLPLVTRAVGLRLDDGRPPQRCAHSGRFRAPAAGRPRSQALRRNDARRHRRMGPHQLRGDHVLDHDRRAGRRGRALRHRADDLALPQPRSIGERASTDRLRQAAPVHPIVDQARPERPADGRGHWRALPAGLRERLGAGPARRGVHDPPASDRHCLRGARRARTQPCRQLRESPRLLGRHRQLALCNALPHEVSPRARRSVRARPDRCAPAPVAPRCRSPDTSPVCAPRST